MITKAWGGIVVPTRHRIMCKAVTALLAASASGGAQIAAPPQLHLVQEIRIDGVIADISAVGAVAMTDDGALVFVEPQDFRVRLHDAKGKEIARVGRQGQGPGEFGAVPGRQRSAPALSVGVLQDTIWIYDAGLRRFTYLSREGRFVRTVVPSPEMAGGIIAFDALAASTGGRILGRATWSARDRGFAAMAPSGALNTIGRVPPRTNVVSGGPSNAPGGWGVVVPFIESTYEAVASDGTRIALGMTSIDRRGDGKLSIVVIGAGGDTLSAFDHMFTGVPLSRRVADSTIRARMAPFAQRAGYRDVESKLRAQVPVAASPFRGFRLGSDYSIWLASAPGSTGRTYTVLDQRGNTIGAVVLNKPGAYVAAASLDRLWVVELNADGVPSLVRYRVTR